MFSVALKKELSSVCSFFEAAIQARKLSHAYLLCGSNSELKDLLALELTQILNCDHKTSAGMPCGKCTNCEWLSQGSHPELPCILEPDYEKSKKGVILVKQVQNLLTKLQNRSSYHRVIIIKRSEIESLPAESANSLLKTIEEPNPKILFLLFAKDVQSVLPTIASRCQVLNLPGKNTELNLQEANELAEELWKTKLNWFQATQLASKTVENSELRLVDLLDALNALCLKLFKEQKSSKWLQRMTLIDKTKGRLKAFCSPKPALEELFWSISE
jgi:DNA polymerase III subunit delta'